MSLTITRESPVLPEFSLLMERHTADMHADTPPESIHMMDASALAAPGIDFFVLRDNGIPVGMGAMKRLGATHAEIKSMHVLIEHRGRGHSRRLLDHLLAAARTDGIVRLSLETGTQDGFAAARGLYLRAGFVMCEPFGDYRIDPNSAYMTLAL